MAYVDSYRDLEVYRLSRELATSIFVITQRFPKDEKFSLTDQVRRSSRSVGAQIAEAWAKRRYKKHFISKLTDTDGEQQETQHWIEIARDCKYINEIEAEQLIAKYKTLGKMIGTMIGKASSFCN